MRRILKKLNEEISKIKIEIKTEGFKAGIMCLLAWGAINMYFIAEFKASGKFYATSIMEAILFILFMIGIINIVFYFILNKGKKEGGSKDEL